MIVIHRRANGKSSQWPNLQQFEQNTVFDYNLGYKINIHGSIELVKN